ncbi:hypothetical protein SAMN06298216_2229 [Spirosomataceae bacterium TFI 002]|nr:hypothetical protein SAMN06298216_2229 [Spirosomataceae bacterium TFI 002]
MKFHMTFKNTLYLLLMSTFFFSCKKNVIDGKIEPEEGEYVFFELDLPSNWKHQVLQGVDSSVGYFTDQIDTIRYDHGSMASQKPKETIRFNQNGRIIEEFEVNGVQVIVYGYKTELNDEFLATYFQGKNENARTQLYTFNTANIEKVIKLMKTHKFVIKSKKLEM